MYKVDFKTPVRVYFVGIGGISMSGLAEILIKEGFSVSGSDMKDSDILDILRGMGAEVHVGQRADNITDDIDVAVYTAAIHADNPEFRELQKRKIPMLTRAELLGQIMSNYRYGVAVSGTHGKTTTTAMLSHILLEADTDPTISIGGMLDSIGGNIRVGHTDYFITEACEYTNSYHALNPFISIILNVDEDHLDFFSGIDEIAASFKTFAEKTPSDGLLIINGDMEHTSYITENVKSRVVTFGLKPDNTYSASDITYDSDGHPTYTLIVDGEAKDTVTLHSAGEHNVINSLSAIAAADFLGIDMTCIKAGLLACTSAKRRFEHKGTTGSGVMILDDYAHHPTEIAATLKTAAATPHNKLWCVFQPHTYTRTAALLDRFADVLSKCDHVILADIYAARETDNGEVSSKDLEQKINSKGGSALYLGDFESIENYVEKNCKKNDLLITMGAGNVDTIGETLLKK